MKLSERQLAFLLLTLVLITNSVLLPYLDPLVRQKFSLSNSSSSLVLVTNSLVNLFWSIVIGLLIDRMASIRILLIPGLILTGLGIILFPFAPTFGSLLLIRVIQGIGETTVIVSLLAFGIDDASRKSRTQNLTALLIAFPAAYLISPVLTSIFNIKGVEELFVGLGVLLILPAPYLMREQGIYQGQGATNPRRSSEKKARNVFKVAASVRVPLVFAFIDRYTFGTFAILTAFFIEDRYGFSSTERISFPTILFWIGFIVSTIYTGYAIRKKGALLPLVAGSFIYGICLLFLPQFTYSIFSFLMFLCGFFSALMFIPSYELVGALSIKGERGTASGLMNIAGTLGMICGLVFSGIISDFSYNSAFALAGLLEIYCALVILLFSYRFWKVRIRALQSNSKQTQV